MNVTFTIMNSKKFLGIFYSLTPINTSINTYPNPIYTQYVDNQEIYLSQTTMEQASKSLLISLRPC